jgi:hypothetical protein
VEETAAALKAKGTRAAAKAAANLQERESKDGPAAHCVAGPLCFVSGNMTRFHTIAAVFILSAIVTGPVSAAAATPISVPLADTWDCDWDGFCKFWRNQLGKTTGVVGVSGVIVGIGALIVCSAKKKT